MIAHNLRLLRQHNGRRMALLGIAAVLALVLGMHSPPSHVEAAGASQVSAGNAHTCAVAAGGSVVCWGDDSYGETNVPSGLTAAQVSAGLSFSCALKSDGSVICWGDDSVGETNVPSGLVATQVSAGDYQACALKVSGSVVCWGDDFSGQTNVPSGLTATQASAGGFYSCALKSDSSVVCWGDDSSHQTEVPSGLTATQVSAGGLQTCALKSDGGVVCWGDDHYGETNVPSGLTATQISAGDAHSCALKSDGSVVCWGLDSSHQTDVPSGLTAPNDTTPPVVAVPANMTIEATGPSGAVATFTATATDPDDTAGPVTCAPASGTTFAIGTTTVTCSSTDTHANTGKAAFSVTVQDTTPPVLTLSFPAPPVNQNGYWDSASGQVPVAGTVTATDLVDVASTSCADGGAALTIAWSGSPPGPNVTSVSGALSVTGDGTHSLLCAAKDGAGNSASNGATVKIDTTPPVIIVTAPASNATYQLNQSVAAGYTCTDATSGVATCSGPVANGSNIDTSTAGTHALTVNAADTAGNTSSASVSYVVNSPPTVSPGGGSGSSYSGNEGVPVNLTGSASDADGDSVSSYLWSLPSGTPCLIANPTQAAATVTCTEEGSYTLTLTAMDSAGLSGKATATLAIVDSTPVVILLTTPASPVAVGSVVQASGSFTDAGSVASDESYTAIWDWGDGSPTSTVAATRPSGSSSGSASGSHAYANAGVYTITLTVADDDGATSAPVSSSQYIVVYDPSAGFVTGGGWIDSPAGACVSADAPSGACSDTTATGKATFGFVAKYQHGATVPSGNTRFQFQTGNLDFKSTSLDWLVVQGGSGLAQYHGTGTINGQGSYSFTLTAYDHEMNSSCGTVDGFRIQIKSAGGIVYDNMLPQVGSSNATDCHDTQGIGGGDIVIHSN